MKKFDIPQINNPTYWDKSQTALDFGLRQIKYAELAIGETVAELGCGLSPFLSRLNAEERWGIDFSPETIKTAKQKYPEINYLCEDVLHTSLPDKSVDTSVAGEVIEHLENPEDLIKEMTRITKKRIIISTPNLEFEDKEHLWSFTENDFTERGFDVETIKSDRFPGRSYIFAWKDIII